MLTVHAAKLINGTDASKNMAQICTIKLEECRLKWAVPIHSSKQTYTLIHLFTPSMLIKVVSWSSNHNNSNDNNNPTILSIDSLILHLIHIHTHTHQSIISIVHIIVTLSSSSFFVFSYYSTWSLILNFCFCSLYIEMVWQDRRHHHNIE